MLRYKVGEYFAPHKDGNVIRGATRGDRMIGLEHGEAGDSSRLTLLIYLNAHGEMIGGETNFLKPSDYEVKVSVTPDTGKALFFVHDLVHEGA